MRNILLVTILFVLGSLICYSSSMVYAQENELDYTYGTVVNITPDKIIIEEYDYDNEENIETSYSIGANTEIENVQSTEDIEPGDYVDIDYMMKDGARTAITIIVEKEIVEEPVEEEIEEEVEIYEIE